MYHRNTPQAFRALEQPMIAGVEHLFDIDQYKLRLGLRWNAPPDKVRVL